MKNLAHLLFLMLTVVACNTASEKANNKSQNSAKEGETKEVLAESLPGADYSSLLIDFNCDLSEAELAKAMEIPSTDIVRTNSKEQTQKTLGLSDSDMDQLANLNKDKAKDDEGCQFELKGFGVDNFGHDMLLNFTATKMTQAAVKKEINGYLERKNDGLEKVAKMYIVKADTQDSYIATQLRYGRVIIYNENHDGAFLISYGINNANNNRTTEQHEALTQKMVKLANYLLEKHRR